MLPPVLLDILCRLAVNSPAAQRLAAVENRFAFGQRDLTLDKVIFRVEAERNQCQALFLRASHELVDFLPVQQQPPVAERARIHIAPGGIGSDVAIDKPYLAVPHRGVSVLQARFAAVDGFHFGPGQLDPSFVFFQEMIKVRGLPVYGQISVSRIFASLRHRFSSAITKTVKKSLYQELRRGAAPPSITPPDYMPPHRAERDRDPEPHVPSRPSCRSARPPPSAG